MKTLLQITNVTKKYGSRVLFDDASLHIMEGDKIGCIGRNGAGKSTLCRMIMGQEQPDSGQLLHSDFLRLGYLEQHDPFTPDEQVLQFLVRYTHKPEWFCSKTAAEFQISDQMLAATMGSLSGGFQTRVKLVAMVIQEPNFIILDEPTNFLDLKTILLLEHFLQNFEGGFLLISHDREFLRRTCQYTLEVAHGSMELYRAPIDSFLIYKESREEHIENYNKNIEAKRKHMQRFIDRFRAKATKAPQAQAKMKQLAKLQTIDVPKDQKTLNMKLPELPPQKGLAFEAAYLSIGYPDAIIARDINLFVPLGVHVAIVGENGQGKTTFLKTLAGELSPRGGKLRWGYQIKIGYYAQHVYQNISGDCDVYSYLRRCAAQEIVEQEILDIAGSFLFSGDDVHKSISVLSGGERARLCLAGILLTKYQVLLLDEPTNHLDFESVEALAQALRHFNGTVFFISHDRTFVNMLADEIIEVKQGGITRFPGTYEEYVYSLAQSIQEVAQADERGKRLSQNATVDNKKKAREEIKALEKQVRATERQKQKLEALFESGSYDVRSKEWMEHQKLVALLASLEEQWFALQEQVTQDD
jgi:ATP-binding cassette subfamily F protein 3